MLQYTTCSCVVGLNGVYILYVLCVVSSELFVAPAYNVHTTHTCSMFSHICLYAVCVVCVCVGLSSLPTLVMRPLDPKIDRIEQQASM